MEYLGALLAIGMTLAQVNICYQYITLKYVDQTVFFPPGEQDLVHNQMLLNLALEVEEYRQRQQDEKDEAQRQHFQQVIESGGEELVDTILAIHGFDLHPEEWDDDDNVLYLDDFVDAKGK